MDFDVAGPFEVRRYGKKRLITKESIADLKKQLESHSPGLASACGCYVFAKTAGRGTLPFYVGQACRLPLLAEAMNADNRGKYNSVLDKKGKPVLFFLPARTPNGKFRKRPSKGRLPSLDFLERWLIAECLEINAALINNKETRFLKQLHVVGIMNAKQGEWTSDSAALRKVIRS